MKERLLIADEAADQYLDEFVDRFPSIQMVASSCQADMLAGLEALRPTIAYSCVSHGFPRQQHRPLIEAESLQWLHVGGSGYEHFQGFDASRLRLTNGRGVLAPFLADSVIGGLIALNHGFLDYHRELSQGGFAARTHPALSGQVLVIVGAGAIGTALAHKAKTFGLECISVSRRPPPVGIFDQSVRMEKLDDVLALADIVSLHLPLTETTRNLIGAPQLARMKPGALLINCARGGVVDQSALVRTLQAGGLRGAYLDVFETEPLAEDDPIRRLPNVLLTPHCSDQVDDWQIRHARFFMDNLERWLDGRELVNRVG